MVDPAQILHAENLRIGYGGNNQPKVVADELNLSLCRRELISLIGPNGSGKSTLIRTLARIQPPLAGTIHLEGSDLSELTIKAVARKVSTVLTDRIRIGNLTVYDLIAFGRSPYTGMMGRLTTDDQIIVEWAIEATGLSDFAGRDIQKLSDGECQKVMIARALAQDTPVILLDEPTAHLDLPSRVEIIRLLRKLARDTGKAILMSTHELDLALKASDQIWLMDRGKKLQFGTPEDLVLNGTFEEVFRRDSFEFDRETGSFKIHDGQNKRITLSGTTVPLYWTRRALEREGYKVDKIGREGKIQALQNDKEIVWIINNSVKVNTIEDLINYLRDNETN